MLVIYNVGLLFLVFARDKIFDVKRHDSTVDETDWPGSKEYERKEKKRRKMKDFFPVPAIIYFFVFLWVKCNPWDSLQEIAIR